jgi:hypothetical protein
VVISSRSTGRTIARSRSFQKTSSMDAAVRMIPVRLLTMKTTQIETAQKMRRRSILVPRLKLLTIPCGRC